jgi:hypothetical protein
LVLLLESVVSAGCSSSIIMLHYGLESGTCMFSALSAYTAT